MEWYLAWAVVLVAAPMPLVYTLNISMVDAPPRLLVHDLGAAAYTWWLVAVALSSRPRWIDRMIGLPAVYTMHAVLGVLALGAATAHVLASFTMHPVIRWTGRIAWYLAIFGVLYAGLFMSGLLVDRLPRAARLKAKAERVLAHRVSVWVHRLNLVAIVLILVHVHVIPRVARATGFVIAMDVYTFVALAAYVWGRFAAPALRPNRGVVIANETLGRHTRRLSIELDGRTPAPMAGDYYFISVHGVPGVTTESHPFSVTFAPSGERGGAVDFTIREAGDFTGTVEMIPVGADVVLEGPFGRFGPVIEATNPSRRLVLVGMGTGIAPLIGIAQQYAGVRPVTVLRTVRSPGDLHDDALLARLAEEHESFVYERRVHRWDAAQVTACIAPEDLRTALFIVVGPAPAVLGARRMLRGIGVPSRHIEDERLTM